MTALLLHDPVRPALRQRGEATRRRILETAIDAFARDGFEGVSTRDLAAKAGVHLPAFRYYFGSKEGLYHAAARHIVAEVAADMAPMVVRIDAALADPATGRADLLDLLGGLIEFFVAMVFGDAQLESRRLFFLRAELGPGPTLDPVDENAMRLYLAPCRALVAALLGRAPDDETVGLRALMILGPVTVLCNPRAQLALGWRSFPPDRLAEVSAMARRVALSSFTTGFTAGGEG